MQLLISLARASITACLDARSALMRSDFAFFVGSRLLSGISSSSNFGRCHVWGYNPDHNAHTADLALFQKSRSHLERPDGRRLHFCNMGYNNAAGC